MEENLLTISDVEDSNKTFTELFNTYNSKLVKAAFYYTKDIAEAEDIVQEVFINFFNKIENFSSEGSFYSYLLKCVKSKCKDLRLKRETQQKRFNKYIITGSNLYITHSSNSLENKEIINELIRVINKLPKESIQKKIFISRYIHEKSAKEIATELNLGVIDVRNRLSRSIQRVRVNIKKDFKTK